MYADSDEREAQGSSGAQSGPERSGPHDLRLRESLTLRDAEPVSVILAVRDDATEAWLRQVLDEHPLVRIVAKAHDALEATQMCRELNPTACIIEAELPSIDGYETCELLSLAAPSVATILVHRDEWVAGPQAAMRLGARACLTAGEDNMLLLEVMTKLVNIAKRRHSPEFVRATNPTMMPNVIGVSSAKGGVGKTTIAVNLAVLMAQSYPDQTILVDYYSQYGDAALLLGLPVSNNIVEYAREDTEMLLPRYLQTHRSGLKLLPGATEPDGREDPLTSEAFAGRMLTSLRTQFRVIILDLPPWLNSATMHLISRCNHFLVICNYMELTALRDTMLLVNSIRDNSLGGRHLKIVANRVTRANRHLSQDVLKMTDRAVTHELPEDAQLSTEATNSGIPFVLSHARNPLSTALRGLSALVDHQPQPEAPKPPSEVSKPSLLGSLFGTKRPGNA